MDGALRLLPSRGWTGGLFGRRDRCLLVLSQLARIPHRHLAHLTAGDVTVADGVATSPHVCREPLALDERSAGHPLLAPVTQWDTPRSR